MAGADGIWKIRIQTGKGDQDWHLAFETAGAGFTGTMTMQPDVVDLEGGKIDGDDLTWESTLQPPNRVKVRGKATLAGDAISGALDMGPYGVRTFTGARV